jgi:hypothetical protein
MVCQIESFLLRLGRGGFLTFTLDYMSMSLMMSLNYRLDLIYKRLNRLILFLFLDLFRGFGDANLHIYYFSSCVFGGTTSCAFIFA